MDLATTLSWIQNRHGGNSVSNLLLYPCKSSLINGYAASGEVDIFAGASGQWRGGLLGAGDGRLGGSLGGACRMEGWLAGLVARLLGE